MQLGVEDREPQPVVGEAVLWRALPAQDVGPPACLASLPVYMLLPAVQRLKITGDCPLEQRLRLSRWAHRGWSPVQEGLHKARDKCRGLVCQPWNVFVMRIPVAASTA